MLPRRPEVPWKKGLTSVTPDRATDRLALSNSTLWLAYVEEIQLVLFMIFFYSTANRLVESALERRPALVTKLIHNEKKMLDKKQEDRFQKQRPLTVLNTILLTDDWWVPLKCLKVIIEYFSDEYIFTLWKKNWTRMHSQRHPPCFNNCVVYRVTHCLANSRHLKKVTCSNV